MEKNAVKNYLGSRRITNLDYGPLIKKVGNGCRKIHTINNLDDLRRKNCGKSNAAVKAGNHSCCGVVKFWGNYVGYRYIHSPIPLGMGECFVEDCAVCFQSVQKVR